jgi:hypothetical protein
MPVLGAEDRVAFLAQGFRGGGDLVKVILVCARDGKRTLLESREIALKIDHDHADFCSGGSRRGTHDSQIDHAEHQDHTDQIKAPHGAPPFSGFRFYNGNFKVFSISEKTDASFLLQLAISGPVLHPSTPVNVIEKRPRRVEPFEKLAVIR